MQWQALCQQPRLDVPRQVTRKNHSGRVFQRRRSSARLWEQLREYFEVGFRAENYGVPYFLSESAAKRPTERGGRSKSAERGRGFKCTGHRREALGVGRLSRRRHFYPEG